MLNITMVEWLIMTNNEKIKFILNALEKLWIQHSSMRFGQLLENFVFIDGERGDLTSCMLFYQEDCDTIANLISTLAHYGSNVIDE